MTRSVAVVGSCMTRDVFNSRFNPTWREHFDVVLSTNQSSLVALMSPPISEAWAPTREMSDYDTWNVGSDLTREALAQLAEEQPDVLVLDFFADVWFGVAELPDGRYLTDNYWKTHFTDLYQRHLERDELRTHRHQDGADAYFALWAEALDRFADHVRRTSPGTRVVLHRGWVTDRVVVPGRPRPQSLRRRIGGRPIDVPACRAFWDRLDDHAVATHGWDEVDLRDLRTPTHVDHAWGPFYVHFLEEYHHGFLARLLGLELAATLDPEARRLVELSSAAAQEPWQRRLAVAQAVVARQREQLEELKGLEGLEGRREAPGDASGVRRLARRLRGR